VVSAIALLVVASACNGRGDVPRRLCPRQADLDPTLSLRSWEELAGTAEEAWAIGTRSAPGGIYTDALLCWNGCDWQAVRSPFDEGRLGVFGFLSAVAANGRDVWLAANQMTYVEADEVFGPGGSIHRVGTGHVSCWDDARVFHRIGDSWEEVGPVRADPNVTNPPWDKSRVERTLTALDPGEVWAVDRRCGDSSASPDATLRRWSVRGATTVAVDRSSGPPVRLLVRESRAWPWSNPVKVLFLLAAKASGRWDGSWTWFPLAGKDTPWLLAGGEASDLWAFGEGAQHWDGSRWAVARAPSARPLDGTPQVVFMWAGAAAGGHTFALDSLGNVFRSDGARVESIGRVHGQFVALAAGADELWLWGTGSLGPPVVRWRAGQWELSPSAKEAKVSLESPPRR
jgi:hypothetical protein